ncbi:hypothetical protein ACWGDT_02005 [Streptomyces avermitilis]
MILLRADVDQGLVAADGAVGADLEVDPAEFILDLFVALLDPRPQSVEEQVVEPGRVVLNGPGAGGHGRRAVIFSP